MSVPFYRPIFLCIFSSALLLLSFPDYNLWHAAWVALVPFFIAIRQKKAGEVVFLSFFTGTVFFYSLICWMNYVAFAATFFLALYLALYFLLFGAYAGICLNRPIPIFIRCGLLAAFWMVLEFIRTNAFTGFGWGLLGYSQSFNLPIIQMADISGAYGVSFLIVFVNAAIYELFFKNNRDEIAAPPTGARNDMVGRLLYNKLINLLLILAVVFICVFYGFYKLNVLRATSNEQRATISVIQGSIPQHLKWDEDYAEDILRRYTGLTEDALADDPDLIIWPETAYPYPDINAGDFTAKGGQLYLIGANRVTEDDRIFNSALLINSKGEALRFYDKINLVPFGEYMPFEFPAFMRMFLPEKINMVGDFSPGQEFTVFELPTPNPQSPTPFSVLICFEDTFPDLSRAFVRNGARLLINITNDAWFGRTAAPYQHAQASVFRAVENRRPVIRCANTGLSAFISHTGEVYDSVKDMKNEETFIAGHKTALVSIPEEFPLTFYNRYGNILIYLSALLLIGAAFILPKTHKLLRKSKA